MRVYGLPGLGGLHNGFGDAQIFQAVACAHYRLGSLTPHQRAEMFHLHTTLLLTGTIPDHTEPVAWTHDYKGARVFYTSLGHPDDFADPAFRTLLRNAILWALNQPSGLKK